MNLPRNHLFSVGEPMILRCGWQLGVEYCDDDPPELLPDTVRMSFDRRGMGCQNVFRTKLVGSSGFVMIQC